MKTIVVIGGGAAGMMASSTIVEAERAEIEVILIEKSDRLGKKVLLTGGGRCNVTTGLKDLREILTKYPRGGKFLRDSMYNFSPQMMMEWVSAHGVPLKTENDLRVFPVSNSSYDIVEIFENVLSERGVDVIFGIKDLHVEKERDGFEIVFNNGRVLHATEIVLTTGSSPEGYAIAKKMGHTLTELVPSLCGLYVSDHLVKNLAGLSFKDVKLKLVCDSGSNFEFRGPVLFSHKGITGPACFALSALSAYEKIDKLTPAKLRLDFLPEFSYEKLLADVTNELVKNSKKIFQNTLGLFMPKSFVTEVLGQIGCDGSKRNSDIAKSDLNKVVEAFKNLQVVVTGRSIGEEFVTAGGVDLSEVNPKTMESKICPGLYFAGEILDIDGFTGGFNLQSAWATGRKAGESLLIK